jgi:signal transduction histidine kinase
MRKAVIGVLMASVLLAMGVLQAANLQRARDETEQSAETRAASLALILSQYLAQTFAGGDAALRQLALHSQRIGGPDAPARDWSPSLASALAGLNGIGSISVVDDAGIIRHSTLRSIVGQSRRGEGAVQRALQAGTDDAIVGTPFLSPVQPGNYIVPLARRLVDADGRTTGAVVASFIAADLRPFFRSINVGARGAVWVIHDDGVLMAHEPTAANPIGQAVSSHPVFQLASGGQPNGIVRGPLENGGAETITAFRRVPALSLIVAIALDRDEVGAAWKREALGTAISFAVVAGVLAMVLVVLFRQMDLKARAEQQLEQARQDEALRLREARDRLAETLLQEQAARQEAQAANALKDQFLMTVSHELRTPLTAIAGWARMLVDGLVPGDRMDQALRAIDRNAQAQARLVEDLLDVAGSIRGKLRLDIRDTSVDDVIHDAVESLGQAAAAKGLTIDVRIASPIGRIAADPSRLQQIIWNLVSNAVKFTPSGGRVEVAAVRTATAVEIRVSDSGVGIAPEFLPQVFNRFSQAQASASRRQGGLGLGLAIVQNLVTLHGGEVTAQSDGHGTGATFVVRLPAAAAATPSSAGARYVAEIGKGGEAGQEPVSAAAAGHEPR